MEGSNETKPFTEFQYIGNSGPQLQSPSSQFNRTYYLFIGALGESLAWERPQNAINNHRNKRGNMSEDGLREYGKVGK